MPRHELRLALAFFSASFTVAACGDDPAGTAPDPCHGVTCDNAGRCAVTGAGTPAAAPICICDAGFIATPGALGCDPAPATDPCDPNPCTGLHRTVCAASGATAVCSCDADTVVDTNGHCVTPPANPCDPNPCTNSHETLCSVDGTSARCSCDAGYQPDGHGGCTTTQVDPCDPNPCTVPGQTTCVGLADGGHRCDCSQGYEPDGAGGCHRPDPCSPNPCTDLHRGECTPGTEGQAVCACDTGYEADASSHCMPVDPCSPNPCADAHRGTCSRGVNGTAVCACDDGFVDEAGTCAPVDPCDPNPCTEPHRSLCSVADAALVACGCDTGYVDSDGSCVPEVVSDCAMQHAAADAFESDDCAAHATAIDALAGPTQAHTLDVAGDSDWFALACASRDTLSVSVTGVDSMHTFYAADGTTVLWSTDSQLFRYRCTVARNLYLRVRHYSDSGTGSYTITFARLPDDHADEAAQATALQPATPTAFALEGPGDIDVFALQAVLGHQYEVSITGADTVTTVRDPSGSVVASGDAQTMRWRALVAGVYDLQASLYSNGGYNDSASIVVTDLGPDDYADDLAHAASIATDNSPVTFALAVPGDVDAFHFACTAGHAYEVVVEGADTMTEAYDASGARVVNSDSQTVRMGSATGTCGLRLYLFGAGGWDDAATVRVRDLGADDAGATSDSALAVVADGSSHAFALALPGDVDAFRFAALAHHAYRIAVTGADTRTVLLDAAGQSLIDTDNQTLWFFAPSDGPVTFQVMLYGAGGWDDAVEVTVTDLGLDTHGWDAATATTVTLDGTATAGAFEVPADVDWFRFSAATGHILKVVVTGTTVAYTLYAADGVTPITTRSASTAFIELVTSGSYVLGLHQDSTAPATYGLSVTDLGLDDHGDTSATATESLVVDAAATSGLIEQPGDVDVFSVVLGAAQAYAAETSGITASVAVYDGAGTKLAESTTNPLLFTSSAAGGTHFVYVRHSATTGYGTYTVRVRR